MKTPEAVRILKRHNKWRKGGNVKQADPRQLSIAIDTIVEYFKCGEKPVQEEKICNDCQRFKHDSPEFPTIGKCYVGEYHCSRKETDICDKPDDFKKRK